jgi:hypothetical protein
MMPLALYQLKRSVPLFLLEMPRSARFQISDRSKALGRDCFPREENALSRNTGQKIRTWHQQKGRLPLRLCL